MSRGTGAEIFSDERTGALILRFAAPAVLSLLVNSLYNIVDQIFVGHGVGTLGNAAVNVGYPVAVAVIAAAALIGDGAAAYFGLRLGEGRKEEAERCLFSALTLSAAAGLALSLVVWPLVEPILRFSGATGELMPMAGPYLTITVLGFPAVIVGAVLAGLIRGDGHPRWAMTCTLTGCVVNIVLDPIFILGFRWGVEGAAWATVIGQWANLAIAVLYLPRFQLVKLHPCPLGLALRTGARLMKLGISGFINQFSGTVYMLVVNRALSTYGAMSLYGAEAALAAYGIVMKASQVATAVMSGIAVGSQPVLSYNYGEGNYQKVLEIARLAVRIVSGFSVLAFLVFQLLPEHIIALFGKQDEMTRRFAVHCFRIFLMAAPLYGFSILTTGLFQAIGKSVHATFMALSRQILYIIPLIYLLAPRFGIVGLLYAAPIGDAIAFLSCLTLYVREVRDLKRPYT